MEVDLDELLKDWRISILAILCLLPVSGLFAYVALSMAVNVGWQFGW